MKSGSPPSAPNLTYPENSLQNLVAPWWIVEGTKDFRRGRLVRAFVPHVGVEPWALDLLDRPDATDHTKANYAIRPLRIHDPRRQPPLPLALWPAFENEVLTVFRAKQRPALIISEGGYDVPDSLRKGSAKWTTQKTVLIAPYYGVEQSATRGGWPVQLVERIIRCEYPQFLWDLLPINKNPTGSILMVNRIQPIGDHHNSLAWTQFCLSDQALEVLDEWLMWFATGQMEEEGTLPTFQELILDS